MPEGHTIFRLALDHEPLLGKRIRVSSPQGRFSEQARLLDSKILRMVESFGKHLVYHWSGKIFLHVHLGLYGKYRWLDDIQVEPKGQVRVRATSGSFGFDLNGPNCCELLTYDEICTLVNRLGPDPLRADAQPRKFQSAVRKSRKPIGSLLLDQKVIAGIGNIYRAEILYLLGINPNVPGCSLTVREIGKIWNKAKSLLKIGVKYNSIITVQGKKPNRKLKRDERVLIYKKEKCPACHSNIEEIEMASRSMYFCPQCQEA